MDPSEIPPDLAKKVLAADVSNAVKDVGEGGKLTAPHRELMENIIRTPDLVRQQRVAALLDLYCGGKDLTPEQWEEVRAVHPGFAAVSPPPAPAAPAPASFSLDANAPAKLSKADQLRYTTLYKKGWRTIYRWIEKGEQAGDPCPLDDPRAMLVWWPRHHTWRVPPEIEAAAAAQTSPAPVASSEAPAASPGETVSAAPTPSTNQDRAIDIDQFDPEEGSRIRELMQVQKGKFGIWKRALTLGASDAGILEKEYLNLSESIDKLITREKARMHKEGLYVLRSVVEADLAANAELLRQSAEAMERRVLELCPSLNQEQRSEVAAAIRRARASEARTFVNLPNLTTNDLLRELQAA